MPVYPCAWPTCAAYVARRGQHCDDHSECAYGGRREQARIYNANRPEWSQQFYNSAEWQRVRREKLTLNPVCERCLRAFAKHVHHIIALERCTIEQRTALSNLMSLCIPCHTAEEKEAPR